MVTHRIKARVNASAGAVRWPITRTGTDMEALSIKSFLITMIVVYMLKVILAAICLRVAHPRRMTRSLKDDFWSLVVAGVMLGWTITLLVKLP